MSKIPITLDVNGGQAMSKRRAPSTKAGSVGTGPDKRLTPGSSRGGTPVRNVACRREPVAVPALMSQQVRHSDHRFFLTTATAPAQRRRPASWHHSHIRT